MTFSLPKIVLRYTISSEVVAHLDKLRLFTIPVGLRVLGKKLLS
jgi:hypothetical protein